MMRRGRGRRRRRRRGKKGRRVQFLRIVRRRCWIYSKMDLFKDGDIENW